MHVFGDSYQDLLRIMNHLGPHVYSSFADVLFSTQTIYLFLKAYLIERSGADKTIPASQ